MIFNLDVFISYLIQLHEVTEEKRKFYKLWLNKFDNFCCANSRDMQLKEVDPFLIELAGSAEEWQVEQAERVMRLLAGSL